jgi:2-polyprenyl-3-methyl-5-hydroxy-6-metoxy-1,4-benzoquinol methylase
MKTCKCTICGSTSKIEFEYDLWNVYRCMYCKHAFSANIKKEIGNIYNEEYFEKNWFKYPDIKLYKKIKDSIKGRFSKDAKVHDIGCGNGNFLKYLKDSGYINLSGSDIVSCLKEELDEKVLFYKSSFEDLKFEESFDFISSIANIEHVNDIQKYAKTLYLLLKPGGICAIYTVNESGLIYRTARYIRKFGILSPSKQLYDPHHINHFNQKSLKDLLTQNNFSVLELQTSNFPLKSTDVFTNFLPIRLIILIFIFMLNTLGSIMGNQVAQLLIVQKAESK